MRLDSILLMYFNRKWNSPDDAVPHENQPLSRIRGRGAKVAAMLLAIPSWLWVLFTLVASASQTARNAMQRDLTGTVGTAGATCVRFLYGLPFAVLSLAIQRWVTGVETPDLDARALLWGVVGSGTQVLATALMLIAMKGRSFVVTIACTKTEPVLVALFSILFLSETPTPMVALAIAVATLGVLVMSFPKAGPGGERPGPRPLLVGVASAAFFGLSATGYRGAILAIHSPSFLMTATTTLVMGLTMQSIFIVVWLALRDRPLLAAIARAWRPSLLAGFMGAVASQFWFLAFAISTPTKVRTLALVEVPFAQVVSRGMFKQGATAREALGIALIVAGVVMLLAG